MAGVLAAVLSAWLSDVFDVGAGLVALIGLGAVAWAGIVYWLARRPGVRTSLVSVALANTLAVMGVLVLVFVTDGVGARVLLVGVALAVAAFAVTQFAILTRR